MVYIMGIQFALFWLGPRMDRRLLEKGKTRQDIILLKELMDQWIHKNTLEKGIAWE